MTVRRSQLLSAGFLVVLLVLGGVGYRVGRAAQTAVLESQSGSISSYETDPTAPGFRAFTTSTPTVLVVHTAVSTSGAELVGATVLTAADGGSGGTVLTIPRTFTDPNLQDRPLAEIFESEGLDATTAELRASLKIGFANLVVLDAASWTTLMVSDLPLDLTLRDDLFVNTADGSRQVLLDAGTRPFELASVARIAAHRNPGEPGLAVALRHQQVWQSWISRTAGSTSRPALFELETGFADVIGALASGEVSYRVLPTITAPTTNPEATRYLANREAIDDLIARIVPFPESAEPGDRPTVLLLDTGFGSVDQSPVVEAVARSGGLVTILGNGDAGAEPRNEVQLHDEVARQVAEAIAERLGLPAPRVVPLEDATASMTVVIG